MFKGDVASIALINQYLAACAPYDGTNGASLGLPLSALPVTASTNSAGVAAPNAGLAAPTGN